MVDVGMGVLKILDTYFSWPITTGLHWFDVNDNSNFRCY